MTRPIELSLNTARVDCIYLCCNLNVRISLAIESFKFLIFSASVSADSNCREASRLSCLWLVVISSISINFVFSTTYAALIESKNEWSFLLSL